MANIDVQPLIDDVQAIEKQLAEILSKQNTSDLKSQAEELARAFQGKIQDIDRTCDNIQREIQLSNEEFQQRRQQMQYEIEQAHRQHDSQADIMMRFNPLFGMILAGQEREAAERMRADIEAKQRAFQESELEHAKFTNTGTENLIKLHQIGGRLREDLEKLAPLLR